jgi:lactate dehydrogenase-like 2-hydroxyacid dehydrogenase
VTASTRPVVAVSARLPEAAVALLSEKAEVRAAGGDGPLPADELRELVRGVDAAVTLLHDRVDDALLEAAGPQLRLVANVAVGFDNIDLAACAARGVTVSNTPGVLTDATADLAMALILMTTRRLGEAERLVRAGVEWRWGLHFNLGASLGGKTLGIIGLGAIGRATAARARAFGMTVAYSGRRRAQPEIEQLLGATFLPFDELLMNADVVSLHLPLTPHTRHLIGEAQLASMKPTAYLINTARGASVDEEALVRALREGTIAGAGLDVYEREPAIHPGLLELENVVLLPHLGSATVETRTAMALLAVRNVIAVLADAPPLTPVLGAPADGAR